MSGQFLGDEAAAQRHEPCAVFQGQRSGYARGCDLALGVADDGGGLDTERTPHLGQGHHDGPEGGLDDVHPFQRRLIPGRPQHIEQIPVDMRSESLGAAVDGFGELG
ncbi:hypothetical protein M271_13815 [Streptomyces rapamycinicus NRRL 5491]|nr:hypothetical protein M271_13815 [Streptomyces rapamycinicus NRRL 5491]